MRALTAAEPSTGRCPLADPAVTIKARGVEIRNVEKSFGSTEVLRDIDLAVEPGTSLALLGPSGCGKTTLLRLIAGLEVPNAGSITVGDTVMADASTFVPPEKRNVGMVFQDWALFPHLTVGRNVGYGLDRSDREGPRVVEALDMVGLADLKERMPDTLSGGQQQRVALARAIAPRPSVLLLDEPFSNLDSALRVGVRTEVHSLLTTLGITSIFVTHDQAEAFVLGDLVAVMNDGRIEQLGPPRDIYQRPASRWVASFVGDINVLDGTANGMTAETTIGTVPLVESAQGAVDVLLRPEDLSLAAGDGATVLRTEYYGHDMMVTVEVSGSELTVRTSARDLSAPGDSVEVTYRGEAATAFS